MAVPSRVLGQDGPRVSAVGYGFGSLGGFYGPAGTLDEKVALLDHVHASGLRFWDIADVYADSEDVVGAWIKQSGKRDDVFLSTKFALQRQPNGHHTFHSDPAYVKSACEKSLHRLGVDTIDLYYCHRVDGVTPIEKTIEAMVELKRSVVSSSTKNSDSRSQGLTCKFSARERSDIWVYQRSQQSRSVELTLSILLPPFKWSTAYSHWTSKNPIFSAHVANWVSLS